MVKDFLKKYKVYGTSLIGSRIYGTFTDSSDYDYIAIIEGNRDLLFGNLINVILHSQASFQNSLNKQSVIAIEAYLSPNKVGDWGFKFSVNKKLLAKSAINRSNSDWGKAVKEYDTKKAFHSIRVLLFAEQLINEGSITDFSAANKYFDNIIEDVEDDRSSLMKRLAVYV